MRTELRDPRRAYRVVDAFEQELADYTGAPYAVTVDSCTNALYASLTYAARDGDRRLSLPRRTYVGVLQAALNAGYTIDWNDTIADWQTYPGFYWITPTGVCDAARTFTRDISADSLGGLICVSFHAAKQLPLGRGGAILTDDHYAVEWLQRFRADGRAPGDLLTRTCPNCFGKGLEGQDDRPGIVLGGMDQTASECHQCGGNRKVAAPYATFPASHCYMPPDTAARGLWILSRWNDSGYSPPPLPVDRYPDLSAITYSAPSNPSGAVPERITVNP